MSHPPGILARGPWPVAAVTTTWRPAAWVAEPAVDAAADAAMAALAERGSPSHDGEAARLAAYTATADGLELVCEPMRWALRIVDAPGAAPLSVQCLVRDTDGRWLAGRRAAWVATWAGRWSLGAGGAVEVDEDPVVALPRELEEEWGVQPERLSLEALLRTQTGMIMLLGLATVPAGTAVVRDEEHDAHAWWPADPAAWPPEADPLLARLARVVA
jgi:8-oxo-dGTP diphosphatase